MKFHKSMLTAAALLAAPVALAQDAPPAPAATTTTPAPAPAATPAPAVDVASVPVTDAEITQFATAALAAGKIRADTTIPEADKNAKLVETVTASGLSAERFNAISTAMQADPALNKRIQDSAAKLQPAAPAK